MEIIIGLLLVAGLAFYLIRKNKEVESELQANESVPYKVETPVVEVAPVIEAPVVEAVKVETPVVEEKQWPMVETAAKPKSRKPRAPAKPKAVPAKSTKTKAPAIKATPAKKPRAPKAK